MAAPIPSLPHDDSQRSDGLAATFGNLRVVDRVVASGAWRCGRLRGRPRSHRRAMSCQISSIFSTRLVDPSRTSVVRSHRKVMHGPCRPPQQVKLALMPPPRLIRTDEPLTAPADRPVPAPAHAVAFTTAVVSIRGAGSVHRRTGMLAARALPVDRNRPESPPATDYRQTHPRRCRPFSLADSPITAARGVVTKVPTSGERSTFPRSAFPRSGAHALRAIAGPREAASVWHLAGHPVPQERRCKVILKEPHARAA